MRAVSSRGEREIEKWHIKIEISEKRNLKPKEKQDTVFLMR